MDIPAFFRRFRIPILAFIITFAIYLLLADQIFGLLFERAMDINLILSREKPDLHHPDLSALIIPAPLYAALAVSLANSILSLLAVLASSKIPFVRKRLEGVNPITIFLSTSFLVAVGIAFSYFMGMKLMVWSSPEASCPAEFFCEFGLIQVFGFIINAIVLGSILAQLPFLAWLIHGKKKGA